MLWILAAVAVALVTLIASQASADGPVAAQEVVRHVVQPGETLWQIAESVAAPSQDVRDVVVDLVRLNELPEAGLMAGQVIVVPRAEPDRGTPRLPSDRPAARLALPHKASWGACRRCETQECELVGPPQYSAAPRRVGP